MPYQVSPDEFEEIVRHIGRRTEGIAVRELFDEIRMVDEGITRRTLQRRLAQLVEEGKIRAIGEGRGRKYVVAQSFGGYKSLEQESFVREDEATQRYGDDRTWMSADARALREQIRQPVRSRKPVGYNNDFVGNYVPNKSFYLPAELRNELRGIGKVGASNLPAGTYVRQIMNRLLIDLSWNSSRLEGNTYSLLETERLLELGEMVDGKKAREAQMILNHKAAIELLVDPAAEAGMNRYTLCNLHALLSDNLMPDPDSCGRLRSCAVGISGSVFQPLEVPQLIEERFDEILWKADAIEDPFEQSFFCMVHLPYLQPFEDVNKRVSRLVSNIPLVRENLCPMSFIDVPQEDYLSAVLSVYELNRVEYLRDLYVWAYRRSAERFTSTRGQLGDPDPFRLKHRSLIGELVREAVTERLHGDAYKIWIDQRIQSLLDLTPAEWRRLREVVDIELASLHEGNIARFKVRLGEFREWKEE